MIQLLPNTVIIIGGATATGKSGVALRLAEYFDTEIISSDSMQIYRGMDIGTAKITPAEMHGIPHHMIDIVPPDSQYSVAQYAEEALKHIDRLHKQGKPAIITGGTGLYISAILYGLTFGENHQDGLRAELQTELEHVGAQLMYQKLLLLDPRAAGAIHPNNTRRVIRAIELATADGAKADNQAVLRPEYNYLLCVLTKPREELFRDIDTRVDDMIETGLLGEVRGLLESGVTFDCQSMSAIGYKEFREYFEGTASIDDVRARIQTNTHHYAKRQETWFKRYKGAVYIDSHLASGLTTEELCVRLVGEQKENYLEH